VLAPPISERTLVARGELDTATAIVAEFLPRTRELEDAQNLLPALIGAAAVEAAKGDLHAAASLVDEFVEAMPTASSVLEELTHVGRLCAATDHFGPLERMLDDLRGLHPRLQRFTTTGRAILAEANGNHTEAASLYERAAHAWESYSCVVERAYALLGLGRCRLALGQSLEAAEPLQSARATFGRLGARLLVAETDALLTEAVPAGAS
jgi:tetratricopeptide (TPR) repeat protein